MINVVESKVKEIISDIKQGKIEQDKGDKEILRLYSLTNSLPCKWCNPSHEYLDCLGCGKGKNFDSQGYDL